MATNALTLDGTDDDDHADSHVRGAQHFRSVRSCRFGHHLAERQYRPGSQLNLRLAALRKDPVEIFREAAAGDVGQAFDESCRKCLPQDGLVVDVWLQQRFADGVLEAFDGRIHGEARNIKEQLAGERIAVRMQASGRKSDQHVAMADRFAVDDLRRDRRHRR